MADTTADVTADDTTSADTSADTAGKDGTAGKPDTGDTTDTASADGDATTGTEKVDRTDWKATSRRHEDRAKANKRAADEATAKATAAEERLQAVLKAAGITEDDEDPTKAVEKATAERDTAVARARQLESERVAERVARGLDANTSALLDSKRVEKALAELEDPFDEDAVTAVLQRALDDAPHLKNTPKARPGPSTADMSGGGEQSGGTDIEALRKGHRTRKGH